MHYDGTKKRDKDPGKPGTADGREQDRYASLLYPGEEPDDAYVTIIPDDEDE
jgi:hypothetical protein